MKIFINLLLVIILATASSNAREDSLTTVARSYFGVFSGYNSNTHIARFTQLPGIPDCCPQYDGGEGVGFAIGGFFEFSLYKNFSTGLRFGYSQLDATFLAFEGTIVKVDNQIVNGKMEHSLKTSVSMISLMPYLSYNLFGGLSLHVGPQVGYYHLRLYELKESIVEPVGRGVFVENGKRTRNEQEGKIPRMTDIYGGLSFGAGYKLPMNSKGTLFIEPEFRYTIGLTNLVNNYDWKINTITAGIAFSYKPKSIRIREIRETTYEIDTISVETDKVSSDIVARGDTTIAVIIRETSRIRTITEIIHRTDTLFTYPVPEFDFTTNSPVFAIDMQYVKESFPMLPFIFFDDNSGWLHNKYKLKNISSFNLKSIEPDPVSFHKNILNIIGSRLAEHAEARITLFGSADPASEPDGCGLASQRSQSVKDYLVEVWGIAGDRILIEKKNANCMPVPYTQTQNEMGHSENRRVEIFTADIRIFEEIINKRLLGTGAVNPPELIIRPIVSSSMAIGAVKSWELTIKGGGIDYSKAYDGTARNMAINFADLLGKNSSPPGEIIINLKLTDNKDRVSSKSKTIKLKQDTSKYEKESISLILFDVGSSKMEAASSRAVERFARSIKGSPEIIITGYTDILGEKQLNIDLADNRAKAVEAFMLELNPGINIVSAEGVDDFSLPPGLHSFNSPEERYLSRTVRIEMIKKAE